MYRTASLQTSLPNTRSPVPITQLLRGHIVSVTAVRSRRSCPEIRRCSAAAQAVQLPDRTKQAVPSTTAARSSNVMIGAGFSSPHRQSPTSPTTRRSPGPEPVEKDRHAHVKQIAHDVGIDPYRGRRRSFVSRQRFFGLLTSRLDPAFAISRQRPMNRAPRQDIPYLVQTSVSVFSRSASACFAWSWRGVRGTRSICTSTPGSAAAPGCCQSIDADVVALQEMYRRAEREFLTEAISERYPYRARPTQTSSPVGSGLLLFPLPVLQTASCRRHAFRIGGRWAGSKACWSPTSNCRHLVEHGLSTCTFPRACRSARSLPR